MATPGIDKSQDLIGGNLMPQRNVFSWPADKKLFLDGQGIYYLYEVEGSGFEGKSSVR